MNYISRIEQIERQMLLKHIKRIPKKTLELAWDEGVIYDIKNHLLSVATGKFIRIK